MSDELRDEYYTRLHFLLKVAGELVEKETLRTNFLDPNNTIAVGHVVEKYYGGSVDRLDASIRRKKRECFEAMDRFNRISKEDKISDKTRLLDRLRNTRRRKFYKNSAKKHQKRGELVGFDQLEREYLQYITSK